MAHSIDSSSSSVPQPSKGGGRSPFSAAACGLPAAGDAAAPSGPADWRCRLLILQPSPFCNLDCDYCYLPDRGNKARMDEPTLVKAFERLFESGLTREQVTIVWHAGEPLAVPVSWYRRAWELVRPLVPAGLRVDESFQTNGTLIDDRWCDWFLERGSFVGVSVDGPALLNDRHRRTRSGQGTFERTRKGMETLQRRGIDFHVISVLTWESLEYADELYEFYVRHGIKRVGFNIDEQEGDNATSTLGREGVVDRYRRFLERFLERVTREPGRLEVRELDGARQALLCPAPPGVEPFNDQTEPFSIVSVAHEGSFSTFSPELLGLKGEPYGSFTLGNVHRDRLLSVADTPLFKALHGDIAAGVKACHEQCAYWRWCGGGAPANKHFENGSMRSTDTLFCTLTRKAVIDVVLTYLERAAAAKAAAAACPA